MTAPNIWIIRDRNGNVRHVPGDPEARVHIPQDLPTYRRLNCIHTGDGAMETRMRAASLEDSCHQMGCDPPSRSLLDAIHETGAVSDCQERQLRRYIKGLRDNQYLVDETLLLLEAAGHAVHANPDNAEE